MTRTRITAALAALTATAVLAAGCGGDDGKTDGTPAAATKSGGTFTGYFTDFPDSLDPALSYNLDGWTALWTAYTPLLTYAHAEGQAGSELKPGLATALPEISADGLTYKLTMRPNLKYSDGSPVKASDFEYTVKRVLHMESPGASFYDGTIEGAQDYEKAGKADGDISGITTDDSTGAITIKLVKPSGQFNFYLAMNFVGIVPSGTAMKDLTATPPRGVGPFKVQKVDSGHSFSLVKNKYFTGLPDTPVAKADEVDITVVKNQRTQAQAVLQNKVDFLQAPPPTDQRLVLKAQAADRYKEYATNSTYYYFLNVEEAPFDNEQVRKAVTTALDFKALAKLYGGLLTPSCNFLPPDLAGYKKITPCPNDGDNAANIAKAKQMVTDAGAAGKEVTVWGTAETPTKEVTDYMSDLLNQIGLKAKPKTLDGSVYYQSIGDQATKAQMGFVSWSQSFPGAADFFALIDGASITKTNNLNPGLVNDSQINTLLTESNQKANVADAVPGYEQVDQILSDKAYVAPYGDANLTKIMSQRMAFDAAIFHPVYALDLTTLAASAQ